MSSYLILPIMDIMQGGAERFENFHPACLKLKTREQEQKKTNQPLPWRRLCLRVKARLELKIVQKRIVDSASQMVPRVSWSWCLGSREAAVQITHCLTELSCLHSSCQCCVLHLHPVVTLTMICWAGIGI